MSGMSQSPVSILSKAQAVALQLCHQYRAPGSPSLVLQPVVYMGIHVVLCWAATLTAMAWWHSKTAHTAFLIFCASVSAWNGESSLSFELVYSA